MPRKTNKEISLKTPPPTPDKSIPNPKWIYPGQVHELSRVEDY